MLCACCVDTQSPTERGSDTGEDPIAHRPLPIKSRRSEGSPAPFPTGVTNIHANSQTQKCAHSSNPLLSTAACQPGDNKTSRGATASGGVLGGRLDWKPDMGICLSKSVTAILTCTYKSSLSFLSLWKIVAIADLPKKQETNPPQKKHDIQKR